jgi:NADPH:quinone reductase-like Zn-dependent oxidoreductase
LVKRLGADEVVDFKKQNFEHDLQNYDVVLGTLRGNELEKSINILKPNSRIVSLIGPPDAAFARARGMNLFFRLVFGLISSKIIRQTKKLGIRYSFLFVQPDGRQLEEIGRLLEANHVVPVIDKIFPFDQAMQALSYLEAGRAKGKVVVKII